jgi:hypothetical protein
VQLVFPWSLGSVTFSVAEEELWVRDGRQPILIA